MNTSARLLALVLASFSSFVAATGCSSAPDEGGDESTEGALSEFNCAQAETKKDVPNAPYGQVVDVRAAGHDGYDRFVIQFAGNGVPNYTVARQQGATFYQDGSGDPIELPGTAGISINVHSASGWNMETGKPTYTGPNRFTPGGAKLMTVAANTGDFEGYVGWGIGLKRAACYRVFELSNPSRLVVDVENNGSTPTTTVEPGTNFHCNADAIASGSMFNGPEPAKPAGYGQVKDVRAASHPDYDRWVMEFEGNDAVPNFRVAKQPNASFTGTGEGPGSHFDLQGQAGLNVSVNPASGWDMNAGHPSFTGSRRFLVSGGTAMKEAAEYEDFEGYVGWGLGLRSANACFRAFKLANPPRLVVDVKK
jgi:hypothetical protein